MALRAPGTARATMPLMRSVRHALTTRPTALATAAVLALAGLSGCGQDEPAAEVAEAPSDPASASTTPTPSETPSEAPEETLSAAPSATGKPSRSASSTPAAPTGLVVDVTVQGDQVSPQAEVVEADIDSPITLQIQSDRAGEMHVHASPEQYVEFGPGSTTAQIVIENPGAIDVEEHETGALVLKLLVQ